MRQRNKPDAAMGEKNCWVAIYVRESRDEKGENIETIETQRDLLIDFVRRNNLGEIKGIYMDDNISGSGFERDGIRRLEEDVINRRVNLLVVKDLSRLGRNNAKTLLFLDFLEEYGVRVITFDGRYDSLKDGDTVGIETWFNERYARDISRKIRANLRFKIEKGEYIGHAPYGYVKSDTEKNRLKIDEASANTVREIFRLYRQGFGYAAIARALNEKCCEPPCRKTDEKRWTPVAVRRIICNRVYTGDTVQGVSEKLSFKSKKTRRLPEDRWVITLNTHEAIISRDEFEEANKIRESKKGFSGTHKGMIHKLRGVLFCGRCGSPMFSRKRKGRPMGYICSNYCKHGTAACTSHHVEEAAIERILVEEIGDLLVERGIIDSVRQMVEGKFLKGRKYADDAEMLKKQLELKYNQQEILYRDRLEGKISEHLFLRINKGLEEKISALKSAIDEIDLKTDETAVFEDVLELVKTHIKNQGLTNEMVRSLVERITVYDAGDNPDITEEAIVIDFKHNKL